MCSEVKDQSHIMARSGGSECGVTGGKAWLGAFIVTKRPAEVFFRSLSRAVWIVPFRKKNSIFPIEGLGRNK